jgi:hypothetical protein
MKDFDVVQRFQATYNLDENLPDHILGDVLLLFLVASYLLK